MRSLFSGSNLEFSKQRYRELHRDQRKESPLALIFSGKKGKEPEWLHRKGRRHGCFARWSLMGPHRGEALLGLRSSLAIFHLIDPGAPVIVSWLTPGICGNIWTRPFIATDAAGH